MESYFIDFLLIYIEFNWIW